MMFVSRDEATRTNKKRKNTKKNFERILKESWEEYQEILKQQNQKS